MGIQIKQRGWMDVNRHFSEGGPHDGTYQIFNLPNGGKVIALFNGSDGKSGTVIKFTTAADVTAFSTADGTKRK